MRTAAARMQDLAYFACEVAMLGLLGFTSTDLVFGMITRSMPSIGIAPRSVWSPITRPPTNPTRFLKRMFDGPDVGDELSAPARQDNLLLVYLF